MVDQNEVIWKDVKHVLGIGIVTKLIKLYNYYETF